MTQVLSGPPRQKRSPMLRSKKHLAAVRAHLCVICNEGNLALAAPNTCQACHVNFLGAEHNRPRGKGEKVDDFFTVPMCEPCHRCQTEDGHSGRGEEAWWYARGYDPEYFCRELAENSPDPKVVAAAKEIFG